MGAIVGRVGDMLGSGNRDFNYSLHAALAGSKHNSRTVAEAAEAAAEVATGNSPSNSPRSLPEVCGEEQQGDGERQQVGIHRSIHVRRLCWQHPQVAQGQTEQRAVGRGGRDGGAGRAGGIR